MDRLGVEVIPRRSNRWLLQANIRTVIDVGANRGQFARTARSLFPESLIYSFEPLEDCFADLSRALGPDPKFHAYNVAVGATEGSITMHRNAFDASSSMLPSSDLLAQNFPFAKAVTDVTVPIRRLDDVFRELTIEPELLVKLDVQGFEDQVIAGGKDVLARAKLVLVEVSFETLYEGQPLFDVIYHELTAAGFRYQGNWEQIVSPQDGRAIQADAVFVKP